MSFLLGCRRGEHIPQPAIAWAHRACAWDLLDFTRFQTGAAVAGGQNGGMLVAPDGSVIGISGMSLGESRGGSLRRRPWPGIAALTARRWTLGPAMLNSTRGSGRNQHFEPAASFQDQRMYVIPPPIA